MAEHAVYLADVVLVDRCLTGEQAAARELFRLHQSRVHATLFRVLGRSRDAEDLVQETFIQVFRSLPGFRGEARLATWIDRIAVRVAYRYLAGRRGQPVHLELEVDDGPAADDDPARQTLAREGVRRLYAALAGLSPTARLAFALFAIDGRAIAEVAAAMGATVTATKLRIWRARRALRRQAAADPVLSELLSDVDLSDEAQP